MKRTKGVGTRGDETMCEKRHALMGGKSSRMAVPIRRISEGAAAMMVIGSRTSRIHPVD